MAEEARKVRKQEKLGGLGVYPRKILKNRCSEIALESIKTFIAFVNTSEANLLFLLAVPLILLLTVIIFNCPVVVSDCSIRVFDCSIRVS